MSWLDFLFKPVFSSKCASKTDKTFILEPILTPSGLVDSLDDGPDFDGDSTENTVENTVLELDDQPIENLSDNSDNTVESEVILPEISDEDLEEIPFIYALEAETEAGSEQEFLESTSTEENSVLSSDSETEFDGEITQEPVEFTQDTETERDGEITPAKAQLATDTETDGEPPVELGITEEVISQPKFDSGYFIVGETGEIEIDYLFDGGKYKGELGIFSLDRMDEYDPDTEDFIAEAARRSNSNSELGHIVISDRSEGAHFSGELGETDHNSGEYQGVKTFNMRSGDRFGMMLVPKGSMQQVVDNPGIGGAARPLFSLATANPEDSFHMGQVADVTGEGNIFVFEDLRVDGKSDGDYNDLIFRMNGATGKTAQLDDVIDTAKDWRNSDLGQELINYVTGDDNEKIDSGRGERPFAPTSGMGEGNNDTELEGDRLNTETPTEDKSVEDNGENDENRRGERPFAPTLGSGEENDDTELEGDKALHSDGDRPNTETPTEDIPVEDNDGNRRDEQPFTPTSGTLEALKPGEFIVGETGEVTVDFLFDGGGYKGEVAIFSLEGLEDLDPNSEEFRTEVLQRITDESDRSQIIISDRTEGAKFTGELGEIDRNSGDYTGPKTLQMTPGEKFAVVLAPKGKIEWAVDNPDRPLMFSLDSQQLADATGEGQTFAWEDLDVEKNSDKDYNDLIFRVRGAKGKAEHIDNLIDPEKDWTPTDLGQTILDYGKPETQLGSADQLYNPTEPIIIQGKITDPDGVNQIEKVEILLQKNGEEWIDITEEVEIKTTSDYQKISYEKEGLEPGHYQLKIVAQDSAGKVAEPTVEQFTVLSVGEGEELSDRVKFAIEKATNLGNYEPEQLAGIQQWIVSVQNGEGSPELATQLGATDLGETGHIPHTYIWEFPENLTAQEVAEILGSEYKVEFAYPIVEYKVNWNSPSNEPLVQSGEQWHLTQSGLPEVWEDQDIQGRGVVIGVVDDGFEIDDPTKGLQGHPDLLPNYRKDLSYDFDEQDAYPSRTVDVNLDGQRGSIAPNDINQFKLLSYAQGQIKTAQINLDIDHPNLQGLEVILVSPNAKEIPLTNITANGYSQALPQLQTKGADGLWTLKIKDPNNTNIWGSVHNWSLDFETYNIHGTLATGVAAASGDNNLGGSGVAPEAEWAGLRMGADGTTEVEVARALSNHQDKIDIYNNSWGIGFFNPALASAEFQLEQGIELGRDGKGNIYVFAAGNAAQQDANVNYNSFANSRYTIAVAAIDHQGQHANYSESGTPVFISAYSSDANRTQNITTTGLYTPDGNDTNDYYPDFGGTSASAPFISGVVALMLEANSNLTWRDVQHILAATAIKNDPNDPGWHQNQGGHWVNDKYGFGQVNPKGAVELAKTWQRVAKEETISQKKLIEDRLIPEFDPNKPQSLTSTIKIPPEEDLQLEWVEVKFNGNHRYLGELEIVLEHIDSQGNKTESILALPHENEKYELDQNNQYKWFFTSTHHWGEMAEGTWNLRVRDTVKRNSTRHIPLIPEKRNIWDDWTLTLHGTRPNTVPEVTNLDQEHEYTENTPLSLLPMVITDPDGDKMTVTLELSNPEAGKLVSDGIESNAEGVWTVTGSVAEVNQKLANLQFIPADNFNGNVEISTSITDGKISWPLTGEINLIGSAKNEPPTLQPVQLNGAVVGEPFEVNVPQLLTELNPQDEDGDPVSLNILPPSSGTLTLNGVAVTAETAISGTDTLIWTPDTSGDSVEAFQVVGNDGQDNSAPVAVTVEVTKVPPNNPTTITTPVKVGDELQVNTVTEGHQRSPSVTTLPNGEFVVVWQSGPDGENPRIYGQRYDRNNIPIGDQFQVNTYAEVDSSQQYPAVTGLSNGTFVVTWRSLGQQQDGSRAGVYGQRYDQEGQPLGNEFRINSYTTLSQEFPSIAALDNGEFVVVWQSEEQDGSSYGVYGQRYDNLGDSIGEEFLVNTHTSNYQGGASISTLSDGGFIITWSSLEQDGSGSGIYGQRYDNQGDPVGDEFQVNTYTDGSQKGGAVAGLVDGGFVIAWESESQNGGVYGQQYDSNSQPVGNEFEISTGVRMVDTQHAPEITALPDGGYIVTWESASQDVFHSNGASYSSGIYGKRFDSQGNQVGEEFRVNTHLPNHQQSPSIDSFSNGDFVVAWQSDFQDGDWAGIYAQVFRTRIGNTPPTLSQITPFSGATETQPFTITYQDLLDASNANDGDSDPLSFQIETLTSGSLTKNGQPITPGETTLAEGESLVWTPDSAGDDISAFTVRATDGELTSATPVDVKVDVVALPVVTVTPIFSNASEFGIPGIFILSLPGGALTEDLTVNYTLSGTATNGDDYQPLTGTATIPAGQVSASIIINPIDDQQYEGTETIQVSLATGSDYKGDTNTEHIITLADNDPKPAPKPQYGKISVVVHQVSQMNGSNFDEDFIVTRQADFLTQITIDGQQWESPVVDENDSPSPNWTFSRNLTAVTVPIRIKIFDDDGPIMGYEDADINPQSNAQYLDLTYNLVTGEITGSGVNGQKGEQIISQGNGDGNSAQITFSIDHTPLYLGETLATIGTFARSGPGTQYPVVNEYPLGSKVTFDRWEKGTFVDYSNDPEIDGYATDLWYHVEGKNEWISASIVKDLPQY
jgi:subtilisin-like proprotein convertase family protein